MSLLQKLFGRKSKHDAAHALYVETIRAARNPILYSVYGVSDTPEGRYELLALMAFSVLHRLKSIGDMESLAQRYFDIMTEDLDSNLREMGVGDVSVAKNVKKLAGGVFGRINAYETALNENSDDRLREALVKFVYREMPAGADAVAGLTTYVRMVDQGLSGMGAADAKKGIISIPAPDKTAQAAASGPGGQKDTEVAQ